jgi:hypothetical protein
MLMLSKCPRERIPVSALDSNERGIRISLAITLGQLQTVDSKSILEPTTTAYLQRISLGVTNSKRS